MSGERIPELLELLEDEPEDTLLRLTLGMEYLDVGDAAGAVGEFERVLAVDPRYTVAYRHLGTALHAVGRVDEAIAAWERGVRVAGETGDIQAGKEMEVLLTRARSSGG
jgi:Tfp pilus assembly protein PilF